MKFKIAITMLTAALITSCASMFNSMVFPNQCQKCAVVDTTYGDTLSVFEGCGGENTKLDEAAMISAYQYIKSTGNCNIEVQCHSWKKDPED